MPFNFHNKPIDRYYYYSYFSNEEAKAQRDCVMGSKVRQVGLQPRESAANWDPPTLCISGQITASSHTSTLQATASHPRLLLLSSLGGVVTTLYFAQMILIL